jgi:hypothetical protein
VNAGQTAPHCAVESNRPAGHRYRELASRTGGGFEVVLYWDQRDRSVAVSVRDLGQGNELTFQAEPHRARDAFEHPFAYAAARGLSWQMALVAA